MAPAEGSVGAGAGATVGKLCGLSRAMRGGVGSASLRVGGITVGAIVAVNAVGDILDPATGCLEAGLRAPDGSRIVGTLASLLSGEAPAALQAGMATTIGCVATDARLDKAQACKVAQMAHDGLARSIDPVHTMFDGDAIFTLATGGSGLAGNPSTLGAMAAVVVAASVLRAVREARGLPGIPAIRDMAARAPASPG
jgi:L-aminopeptidase/D-esterase-like protein